MESLTKDTFVSKVYDYKNTTINYNGDLPCVIDWYAEWCQPCKTISPILEQLSSEYSGKINFYKIDVDKEYELSNSFNIKSIPMLMFITKKGEISTLTGSYPKENILKHINVFLIDNENK